MRKKSSIPGEAETLVGKLQEDRLVTGSSTEGRPEANRSNRVTRGV